MCVAVRQIYIEMCIIDANRQIKALNALLKGINPARHEAEMSIENKALKALAKGNGPAWAERGEVKIIGSSSGLGQKYILKAITRPNGGGSRLGLKSDGW